MAGRTTRRGRRARWPALLSAVAVVATGCWVPYDLGGSRGADLSWVVLGDDGPAGVHEWYIAGQDDPIWTYTGEVTQPVAGDWDGDRRWEPGFIVADGVVSSTTTISFPPVEPPGTPTGSACIGRDPVPIPGNWDDDRATELGWFWPGTATWQLPGRAPFDFGRPVLDGETCATGAFDVPVPADYDGDGRTDAAIYQPDTGDWLVHGTPTPMANLGVGIGQPGPADHDGDGDDDPALLKAGDATLYAPGIAPVDFSPHEHGLMPTPADLDGDGTDDPVVWRFAESGGAYQAAGAAPVEVTGWPALARPALLPYVVFLSYAESCVESRPPGTCA